MGDSGRDLEALRVEVRASRVPAHVAVVMDGNGRWAEARGMPRIAGHREGSESVRAVTREARKLGVRFLTLYAFSAQNWARPPEEVAALMDLLREYLLKERSELLDNQVRLSAIGELSRLPPHVTEPLAALRAETGARPAEMVLTLALSYGSREEIVAASRALAAECAAGRLSPAAIDEALVARWLWSAGLPDPDLVIRTGGERRLSNYLLWQAAYAELCFVDTPWPDFREADLLEALREFQRRERRFGKTSAQLAGGRL
ncbi:MAG TPA: polyprenyl diphosphate synthase [Myxococcales bacterium]|jgi:undecaprenyl diphosphate synthase|nr:polyprenyl diphosphate synthase [Myxococcales bacterium]